MTKPAPSSADGPVERHEREEAVRAALRRAEGYIHSHGGSVELVELTDAGHVTVRFGGMCLGCPSRPVTLEATVRPQLRELEFVTGVSAAGARISAEAEARMRHYLTLEPR